MERLVGKTIKAIYIGDGNTRLGFKLDDGATMVFETEGECCSSSWIEHVSNFDDLIGATITGVADIDMSHLNSKEGVYEYTQVYGVAIKAEKGKYKTPVNALLEFRNSSNGYYGGYITGGGTDLSGLEPLTKDF